MTFRIGMKVVCIDNGPDGHVPGEPGVGDIATVSNVFTDETGNLNIELVEFPSPETEDFYAGFMSEYFRPVVERKTDISALKALLVPGPKVREDA